LRATALRVEATAEEAMEGEEATVVDTVAVVEVELVAKPATLAAATAT